MRDRQICVQFIYSRTLGTRYQTREWLIVHSILLSIMLRVTRAAEAAEGQQTSKANTVLGWGEDNVGAYRKWRRRMKHYAAGKPITGR